MRTIFFMNVIIIINTILIYLLSSCEDYIFHALRFFKRHQFQYDCVVNIFHRFDFKKTSPSIWLCYSGHAQSDKTRVKFI